VITLPPLRARQGDVPLLAEHFGRRMAVELDWPNWPGFTPRALADLEAYPWPGNVRELRNVVERAVYRHEDPERPIDQINFNPFHSPWAPAAIASAEGHSAAAEAQDEEAAPVAAASPLPVQAPVSTSDFRTAVAAYERQLLEEALQRNRFNQRATASALGLMPHCPAACGASARRDRRTPRSTTARRHIRGG
jgi:psp operon transcriptional activator